MAHLAVRGRRNSGFVVRCRRGSDRLSLGRSHAPLSARSPCAPSRWSTCCHRAIPDSARSAPARARRPREWLPTWADQAREADLYLPDLECRFTGQLGGGAGRDGQWSTICLSATPSTACRPATTAIPAVVSTMPRRPNACGQPLSNVVTSPMSATPRSTKPMNRPRWLHTQKELEAYSAKAAGALFGSAPRGCGSVETSNTIEPPSALTLARRARATWVVVARFGVCAIGGCVNRIVRSPTP